MLTLTVPGIEEAMKVFDPSIVQKAVTRSLNEVLKVFKVTKGDKYGREKK